MAEPSDLYRQARLWRDHDPDPGTRAELDALVAAGDEAGLAACFEPPLTFGTAGLRGKRGPGPARMNRLLARRVTLAVAQVLQQQVADAARRGVVVGFDARHGSREMALDAAGVLAGAGLPVHLIPDYAPTPLVAFAALQLGTAAAIVLTASHNPPEYGGYKLYWADGAQIVPPLDEEIAAALAALPVDQPIPLVDSEAARVAGRWREHGDALRRAYLDAVRVPPGMGPLRVVYSPMHGVAGDLALAALRGQGIEDIHVVAEQAAPDGDFPTVRAPNPEEPAALELPLAKARACNADLVLANDPDGDRLAVAVNDGNGALVILTGDQIGCLLADHILRQAPAARRARGFVLNTVVSSALLGRIAAAYGCGFEQTLTGFKWLWHRALAREAEGGELLFAYEDAIGFCPYRRVRDKDGIATAVVMCELARACRAEGGSVLARLDELYRVHGLARTRPLTLSLEGAGARERMNERLAALRRSPPGRLADRPVRELHDYASGERRDLRTGEVHALTLPRSNLLQLDLDAGLRVSIRPSGTEPKLKVYLESLGPPGVTDLATARKVADTALDALAEALRQHLEA